MAYASYNPRFADTGLPPDIGSGFGGIADAILQGFFTYQLFKNMEQMRTLREQHLLSMRGEDAGTHPGSSMPASDLPMLPPGFKGPHGLAVPTNTLQKPMADRYIVPGSGYDPFQKNSRMNALFLQSGVSPF